MTHQIDNALLLHGGDDDISIHGAALQQIIDAVASRANSSMISQLRLQNEALEEANKRVCDERDTYKSLCHQLDARLAGREFE